MGTSQSFVIIGNGIAGVTAAESLRAENSTCAITIVADDPFPAYYRPALKDFLGGRLPEEKLWARPATFYQQQKIRFVPARVTDIYPLQHIIQLHNGKSIKYHKLLLANGARSRTLSCPGLNLAGVSTLRTVADYQEVLRRLEHVRHVVISGSGTLALESAETLRHMGFQVTHLLRGTSLWAEVLDPTASELVLHEEQRDGVDVRLEEEIAQIVGKNGQVSGIITRRGEHIPCELVLIAVGIDPLIDFIRKSGIVCGRGVKTDSQMRTSVADIFAAGDVVETTDHLTGRTRVPGQWLPAIQQAQRAARSMLATSEQVLPTNTGLTNGTLYNATFLYGLDFASVGLTTLPAVPGFQELIAPPKARNYRKAILYNGSLVGALLLGDRSQGMAFKRAIDQHINIASVASQLFQESFDFNAWLSEQGVPGPYFNERYALAGKNLPHVQNNTPPTLVITETRYTSQTPSQEIAGYFVPIPHPKIAVFLTEVRITSDQEQVMTIGRQEGVSWLIEHRSISRLHAEVMYANGAYWLRDTGSSNGTFVNGVPQTSSKPYQLRPHDQIRLGDVQFRFELRPRLSPGTPLEAASPTPGGFIHLQGTQFYENASRLIPETILENLPTTPTLVIIMPDNVPRTVALDRGQRYLLGRDAQNDIVLTDPSTSRQHAEIVSASDGFYIRDLNSSYGVFVNQVKITNIFHFAHGDRIVLGNVLLYFSYPQGHTQEKVTGVVETTRTSLPATITRINASQNITEKKSALVGMEHRKKTVPLLSEQLQFEINMCIGCDRCMNVCPVPISSQVTIADLNQATVTKNIPPIVARFTHECVMCGSCVPVCPVDNHRDLLMLSLKQRLGVSWEVHPGMERVAANIPTGWALLQLIQRLREQAFLHEPEQVPDTYLLHIIAISRSLPLEDGAVLLCEGEYGRDLYVILEGQIELATTNRENTALPVAIRRRGEFLGEDGMLTGLPYKFSARTRGPALLFQIPEQAVQRLMELVPGMRIYFENSTQGPSLYTILTRMKLFESVDDADIQSLINLAQIKHYERGERLFTNDQEGRPARETLHILLEGFVKVSRYIPARSGKTQGSEQIIAYRQGGDYFVGGLDLLGDGQAVTITTINRCRVAEVPRQVMLALFQRYPQMERYFELRRQDYINTAAVAQSGTFTSQQRQPLALAASSANPTAQEGLHALVSDGVVEGTEVLVIDLDKCIHCNECEDACERRHGHSRMNRKGMVVGNISIVTACRQCQDPVCLLCSRAGIARHPDGEVYITESCIGCGICAERCPYGAISIAQVDDDAQARSSWQRFSSWFNRNMNTERAHKTLPVVNSSVASGSRVAPAPFDISSSYNGYDELRKKIAIKCDLCAGYGDQACVQACPAGAAFRVKPTSFFGSTEDILRH